MKSKVVLCFLSVCFVLLCKCAAEELPSIDEALTYAIKENDYRRIEVKNTLKEYAVFNDNNFQSKWDKVIVFERLDAEGLFTESKIDCFEPNYEEHKVGEPRLFVRNDLMLLLPPDMRATSMEEADYYTLDERRSSTTLIAIYKNCGQELQNLAFFRPVWYHRCSSITHYN